MFKNDLYFSQTNNPLAYVYNIIHTFVFIQYVSRETECSECMAAKTVCYIPIIYINKCTLYMTVCGWGIYFIILSAVYDCKTDQNKCVMF